MSWFAKIVAYVANLADTLTDWPDTLAFHHQKYVYLLKIKPLKKSIKSAKHHSLFCNQAFNISLQINFHFFSLCQKTYIKRKCCVPFFNISCNDNLLILKYIEGKSFNGHLNVQDTGWIDLDDPTPIKYISILSIIYIQIQTSTYTHIIY